MKLKELLRRALGLPKPPPPPRPPLPDNPYRRHYTRNRSFEELARARRFEKK